MKTKIYVVSFTSYTQSDNYLHSDHREFTSLVPAMNYYESMKDNATENANDIYEDEDGNLDERIVEGREEIHGNNATFTIEREVDTEFGYQAELKMEEVELEYKNPRYMKLPYKVGDTIRWRCDDDGKVHQSKIEFINCEIDKDGPTYDYHVHSYVKGCYQTACVTNADIVTA